MKIPALINAQHNRADITFIVLDNAGTAMTGFQPHPGLAVSAMGEAVPSVDIAKICTAIGAKVAVSDPFDLEETSKILTSFMAESGSLKVLIMRQICALSRDLCITPTFAQFWSLRGAKRRGNLVTYQCVMRLLRFARNDNTGVVQRSQS